MMQKQSGKFGIYFHWPYCLNKCPYCDFNSYAGRAMLHDEITKAYLSELEQVLENINSKKLESIYFGGGTPSLMKTENVSKILGWIDSRYSLQTVEITLEVNPATVDFAKLISLKNAGINRLSIGVQSFDDNNLSFLGRLHDSKGAKQTIRDSRKAGFDNISVDLILATKTSTMETLENDLLEIDRYKPEHVSAYLLTIEPETVFGKQSSAGHILTANESLSADQFDYCRKKLRELGYEHYEISNYAKPNLRSRHNQLYWDGSEYISIGPGAHSYLHSEGKFGVRYGNLLKPEEYIDSIQTSLSAREFSEVLSSSEAVSDAIMTGLRRMDGIKESEFTARTGQTFDAFPAKTLKNLLQQNMITLKTIDQDRVLSLSDKGILFADDVILELF